MSSKTPSVPSTRDRQRLERVVRGLKEHRFDLVVCSLPSHVLLVSGYFPVVGTSIAMATTDGRVLLIVPEDEKELAEHGYADDILVYEPTTLDTLQTVAEAAMPPLRDAWHAVVLG